MNATNSPNIGPQLGIIGNVIKKPSNADKVFSKPFIPSKKLLNESKNEELPIKDITTLRIPIFCTDNKPFVFIKVINTNEKYRLSMNPEFLKSYELNFKILRDQSLLDFIKWSTQFSKKNNREYPLIKKDLDSLNLKNNIQTNIYLKLPQKDKKIIINKHTLILENDGKPGKTLIDKYQIVFPERSINKRTILFIIDRNFENLQNSSITFISEDFETFQDFIAEYSAML